MNFGRIQNLPFILGLVLAVMALLTVAHLLTTSTRRRRRDLAILKTLGFAHGDVGRTVAWQATTLAAITLIAAVPLGIARQRHLHRTRGDRDAAPSCIGAARGVNTKSVAWACWRLT